MDTTSTTTRGASFRRRVAATAAVGAAAAIVAVALHAHVLAGASAPSTVTGASALTDAQLAGWTGTPKPLAATSAAGVAATAWCEDGLAADSAAPATVSDVDERGGIASMLVARGGYTSFCLASGAHQGMWEIVNEPGSTLPSVAPTAIDLQSADQHGTPAIDSAWGSAGADVESVVLHAGGRTVTATVDHGFWTAWWPGKAAPTVMQAVVTTTGGTSTIVTLGSR